MGAIPSSDLPGHKLLHERVVAALDLCQESQAIDFKESAPWENLAARIIKTCIGMGNLRDGGIVVIGVSERGDSWDLNGIQDEHRGTYDVDNIVDAVNKYSSPSITLDIVLVQHRDGKQYLAIRAREFSETPFVCKKDGPAKAGGGLHFYAGDFLIRPPGKAQTRKIMSAEEMDDLLELAAEKTARRMLSFGKKVGLVPKLSDADQFQKERDGL